MGQVWTAPLDQSSEPPGRMPLPLRNGAGPLESTLRVADDPILVTLAETTPELEAAGLQDDLERAGIHPWGWVVINSIAAAHPQSAFLRTRARNEVAQIARVRELADRVAIVPLLSDEPIGVERLSALIGGVPQLA